MGSARSLTAALLTCAAVGLLVWTLTGIYLFILVLPLGAWLWTVGRRGRDLRRLRRQPAGTPAHPVCDSAVQRRPVCGGVRGEGPSGLEASDCR